MPDFDIYPLTGLHKQSSRRLIGRYRHRLLIQPDSSKGGKRGGLENQDRFCLTGIRFGLLGSGKPPEALIRQTTGLLIEHENDYSSMLQNVRWQGEIVRLSPENMRCDFGATE